MSKEREWMVTVPIYGQADIFVTAASEEEARTKAMDGDWSDAEVSNWEVSEACRGSGVCYRTGYDTIRVVVNE